MVSVIVLAGGAGKRMNKPIPKQFLALAGKPVIMHTLERLDRIDMVNEIVIVCHHDYKDFLLNCMESYMLKKNYVLVDGGETRQDSVYNGLCAVSNEVVLIHEAARPFVKESEFKNMIEEPEDAVIYGYSIPFTVSKRDGTYIGGLYERNQLVNVQLPQKFNRNVLMKAHRKAQAEGRIFTEDSSMVYEYTDTKIKIMTGTPYNIKITEPSDLTMGEQIYNEYIVGRD